MLFRTHTAFPSPLSLHAAVVTSASPCRDLRKLVIERGRKEGKEGEWISRRILLPLATPVLFF